MLPLSQARNVLVAADNRPLLIDFGLACHFELDTPEWLRRTVGTKKYRPPEMREGNRNGPGAGGANACMLPRGMRQTAAWFQYICISFGRAGSGPLHGHLLRGFNDRQASAPAA